MAKTQAEDRASDNTQRRKTEAKDPGIGRLSGQHYGDLPGSRITIGHRDLCEPARQTRRGNKTPSRAGTTQRNATCKNLRNKILSHTHLARACLAHTGMACALLVFAFQMSSHSGRLACKCALLLFTLHMIPCCIHITDVWFSRAHACIVFCIAGVGVWGSFWWICRCLCLWYLWGRFLPCALIGSACQMLVPHHTH